MIYDIWSQIKDVVDLADGPHIYKGDDTFFGKVVQNVQYSAQTKSILGRECPEGIRYVQNGLLREKISKNDHFIVSRRFSR